MEVLHHLGLEGEEVPQNHRVEVVVEVLQAQTVLVVEEGVGHRTHLHLEQGEGAAEAHQVPQILLQGEVVAEQGVQSGLGVVEEALVVSLKLSQEEQALLEEVEVEREEQRQE